MKFLRVVGWILFGIFSLLPVAAIGGGVYLQYIRTPEEIPPLPGQEVGLRPNVEGKLNLTVPGENATEEEKINWAYNLYCIANKNWVTMPKVAMAVKFDTGMKVLGQDTLVTGYQFYVKTTEEYWHTEYSFAASGGGLMGSIMQAVAPESTTYAARSYTNKDMQVMQKQLTIQDDTKKKPPSYVQAEDKSLTFNCSWDSATMTEEVVPQFYSGQPGFRDEDHEMTDQRIRPETIKSATIQYHADKGYYEMVLVLDVENPMTTEITLQRLRKNAGDQTAYYSSMVETIEVWDNGYYRYFHSVDQWAAPKGYGAFPLESTLDYNTYFYYDDHSVNPENYQNMVDYRDWLTENNLIK